MSADWTTCRVVRDRDGDLWGHDVVGWRLLGEWSFLLRLLSTEALAALGPIIPVLDADGQPVVTTVGDLTARHIGKRVRWDDGDEGVLDFLGAERCRFECLADLDGRENPRTYGHWLPLNTPCTLLPQEGGES